MTAMKLSYTSSSKLLFLPGLVCFGISIFIATVQVALNRAYGISDLMPFSLWTLPFAGIVVLIKVSLTNSLRSLPVSAHYFLAVTGGAVIGLLWSTIIAFVLGPWSATFSFAVLPCWIAGGAGGTLVNIDGAGGISRAELRYLAIISCVCLTALLLSKPMSVSLRRGQEFEILSVKWQPSSDALSNPEVMGRVLSTEELTRLKHAGLQGEVTYAGLNIFGKGRQTQVIVVMKRPVTEPIHLRLPDAVDVVYVQNEHDWQMYPAEAPTLERSIQISPDPKDPTRVTRYLLERSDGTRQSGTLCTW